MEFINTKQSQIQDVFTKLFNSKGYKPSSHFDKTVWFMKSDRDFQNLIKKGYKVQTPGVGNNDMINLLEQLNEGEDIFSLSVNAGKFIEKVSKKLIELQILKERSEKQIEFYNAHKLKILIEAKISFLKQQNKNLSNLSLIDVNIDDLDLNEDRYAELTYSKLFLFFNRGKSLPVGKYNIEADIDLFNKDSDEDSSEQDYTHKSLSLLNFKIEEVGQYFKQNENNNNFPPIGFGSNFDRRKREPKFYSGCTLANLTLFITKDSKKVTSSSRLDFLDLFLNNIEAIIDSNKNNTFIISYPLKVDPYNNVELDFKFELGDLTCISILNRIFKLFSILLNNAKDCENSISFILENYFQDSISFMVKNLLEKKQETKGCDACTNCNIL